LDDLANFVPARLTACLMILAGALTGRGLRSSVAIWRRDRGATASPNAGQPMSAAAGVLRLELEKTGHYCLGRGLPLPQAADIARAIRLLAVTSALACVVFIGLLVSIKTLRS
jgi:adenosylcobinamide-phosphate synthase